MFKPNGALAKSIDPLLLLNLWAHHVSANSVGSAKKMIFAGLGKPSYFLNEDIISYGLQYWQNYADALTVLKKEIQHLNDAEKCQVIAQSSVAIDYGLPAGDFDTREILAQAFARWYGVEITADDVVFTVGGCSALKMLFAIFNRPASEGVIITPMPYYPFYNNPLHKNNLLVIPVMEQSGYRLTALAVKNAIDDAKNSNKPINAFLFCDPNNPLGTVVSEIEWQEITEVLATTPANVPIIVDEAYAEMVFNDKKHVSLVTIATELKNRIIILRSATKALSASGERMAAVVCFNQEWRSLFIDEILATYAHTPKSQQYIYAHSMNTFSDEQRIALARYYELQVNFVQERLSKINALMPDATYKPHSTFYVLADLSKLLGMSIPDEAALALGKTGVATTDVDICYSLLFDSNIMISPLSFFGIDPHKGFVRITCSGGLELLGELMDRIEQQLKA